MFIECIKRFFKNPIDYLKNPKRTICILVQVLRSSVKKSSNDDNEQEDTNSIESRLKKIYLEEEKIVVKRGPFSGMQYPVYASTGSSLWPKLAGVYEKEIQPLITHSLQYNYEYIIDVGCAEGYYAVGYALKNVAEKVVAFDIDENAQAMCRKMCEANNVSIDIKSLCTPETLREFNFQKSKKSLIIADCEGYERELFTSENRENLKNVDLIIEVHDWLQYPTPTLDYLIQLFSETHDYELVYGIDDYEKAYRYSVEELEEFSLQERYAILKEDRRRLGEWLYFKAKM